MPLTSGTRLGHYEIAAPLGAGGMGEVYLARDARHDRVVAIKVFSHEKSSPEGAERFFREIRSAAQLTHPHILPLIGSGESGSVLFFVRPYIEGETLRERIMRVGGLPIQEGLRILRHVTDALAYAHARGVIHRPPLEQSSERLRIWRRNKQAGRQQITEQISMVSGSWRTRC